MRNTLITTLSLSCFYILWPYIGIFSLYIVLKTGDVEKLKECVDWPSLKKSLQTDLDDLIKIRIKESLIKEKIEVNFSSLTISSKISEKIATPEGLVFLFNNPNEFTQQIRKIFTKTLPLEEIIPPILEKKPFEPEGPNIQNLFERVKYAFFTNLSGFQLTFNQDGLIFTMNWQLQGIFWKLTRIKIPI